MHMTKRRDFLKAGVGAAFIMGSPWPFADCRGSAPGPSPETKPKVAAIRGDDLYSMTREGIETLGGIQSVISEGETVFLKPNFVSIPWAQYNNCFRTGECTKPEIIIAVVEECLKAGAAEVIVGEGSHLPKFDWKYAVTLDGQTDLVTAAQRLSAKYKGKATLACLETDSPDWVEVPSRAPLNKIAVSSLMTNADKVISLPVAKTHSWAQLTLAAKNFIGVTPMSQYAQLISNTWWNRGTFDHSSPQAIAQVYLDIIKAKKIDLSIVDFSIGMEADGPSIGQGGKTVDMKKRLGSWAMIASKDIMAADATAARIMSHDVKKVKQLTMGFEMGLGEIRERSIEMLGERLDSLRVDWKHARMKGHRV